MTDTPTMITGLSAVADEYDALLVDIWGVIHDGRTADMRAVDACARFRETGGPVVLISNSPRRGIHIPEQLEEVGAQGAFYDAIATSGDATRFVLESRRDEAVMTIGPARDERLYAGLSLARVKNVAKADYLCCTGLLDDETESPEDYRALLEEARQRDLDFLCANPDIQVVRGRRTIWCAGALAALYRDLGGRVVEPGKPHAPIYDLARAQLAQIASLPATPRLLAIGDGPKTDLRGANNQGMDALFVAGGLEAARLEDAGADVIAAQLAAQGATARYAMAGLVW